MNRFSRYLIWKLFGGAAFGIGLLIIYAVVIFLAAPHFSYIPTSGDDNNRSVARQLAHNLHFSELTTVEKIKASSAIAIGTYQRAKDGGNEIIIQEYLKKDPGVQLAYAIGTNDSDAISQRAASDDFGDGVIIFYVDSPTRTKMTATIRNGVIQMLNEISLRDFRKLVAASQSGGG